MKLVIVRNKSHFVMKFSQFKVTSIIRQGKSALNKTSTGYILGYFSNSININKKGRIISLFQFSFFVDIHIVKCMV